MSAGLGPFYLKFAAEVRMEGLGTLRPTSLESSQLVTTPSVSHTTSPAQSMWSSMTPNNNAYTSRSRACSTGTPFPRRYACC